MMFVFALRNRKAAGYLWLSPRHACIGQAHAALERENLLDLGIGEKREGFADLERDQVGLAIVLEDFDQPLCVRDGIGPADNPVVRKQNGVVVLDKRQYRFGEGLGSWSLVACDGGRADEDFVLGYQADRRSCAGDCEGRGMGRMAVHDSLSTWVGLVDCEMQKKFTGAWPAAGQHVALEITEADVRGLNVALADHGRRAEHRVRAEAHADVASIPVDVAALPKLLADGDDFGTQSIGFVGASRP